MEGVVETFWIKEDRSFSLFMLLSDFTFLLAVVFLQGLIMYRLLRWMNRAGRTYTLQVGESTGKHFRIPFTENEMGNAILLIVRVLVDFFSLP